MHQLVYSIQNNIVTVLIVSTCYAYAVKIFISDKCYVRVNAVFATDSSFILCFVVVQELWRGEENNGASFDKVLLVQ